MRFPSSIILVATAMILPSAHRRSRPSAARQHLSTSFPGSTTATPSQLNTAHGIAPTASATEVIRIPMHSGHADGSYEDFLTGFVTKDGQVWGRPVGVAIAKDGSMLITDDGSHSVWHVSYIGK
jgi:glucose/arabinose dehydrogenase